MAQEIDEKLKQYILSKYGSVQAFVNDTTLKYTTVLTILKRGVNNSNAQNVLEICRVLDISADELADGRITPLADAPKFDGEPMQVEDLRRLARIMAYQQMLVGKEKEPLTPDDIQTVDDAIEIAIEMIKRRHKRNRGDSE